MKKFLAVLLLTILMLSLPTEANLKQCGIDSDCKLIYSSRDCKAVPASDTRTILQSSAACLRNVCRSGYVRSVIAVCKRGRCVKKKSKPAFAGQSKSP